MKKERQFRWLILLVTLILFSGCDLHAKINSPKLINPKKTNIELVGGFHIVDQDIYYTGLLIENMSSNQSSENCYLIKYSKTTDEHTAIQSIPISDGFYTDQALWYSTDEGIYSCSLISGEKRLVIEKADEFFIRPIGVCSEKIMLHRFYLDKNGIQPLLLHSYSVYNVETGIEIFLQEKGEEEWEICGWTSSQMSYSTRNEHGCSLYFIENEKKKVLYETDGGAELRCVSDEEYVVWTTIASNNQHVLHYLSLSDDCINTKDISFTSDIVELYISNGIIYILEKFPYTLYSFDPCTGKTGVVFANYLSVDLPLVFVGTSYYHFSNKEGWLSFIAESTEPLYFIE